MRARSSHVHRDAQRRASHRTRGRRATRSLTSYPRPPSVERVPPLSPLSSQPPRPEGSITSACRSVPMRWPPCAGWPSTTGAARRRMRLVAPCVCPPFAGFRRARKPRTSSRSVAQGTARSRVDSPPSRTSGAPCSPLPSAVRVWAWSTAPLMCPSYRVPTIGQMMQQESRYQYLMKIPLGLSGQAQRSPLSLKRRDHPTSQRRLWHRKSKKTANGETPIWTP